MTIADGSRRLHLPSRTSCELVVVERSRRVIAAWPGPVASGGGSGGAGGAQAPHRCNLHEAPLSLSYKFEKEEGGEGLEEEEGETVPPAVIPGSATACGIRPR